MAAQSQLVFPSAATVAFQSSRSEIRSGLRDTYNRLHSIAEDAAFVADEVTSAFPSLPLVANQRAGAWYVRPRADMPRAYFKSTDGHTGVHDFNLRRANLSLVPYIISHKGIAIVDSTRRGKRFPDALSKTLPIWCAVLNHTRTKLSPPKTEEECRSWAENGKLWTLPTAVSRSEHDQIAQKIDGWSARLLGSSYDLTGLRDLPKPLRPIFVSPSSQLSRSSSSTPADLPYIPVVLVSASKLAKAEDGLERSAGYTYVQGSGDDHESWSKGLTPDVFWAHENEILSAPREDIDAVIENILSRERTPVSSFSDSTSTLAIQGVPIRRTGITLVLSNSSQASPSQSDPAKFTIVIETTKTPSATSSPPDPNSTSLKLQAKPDKAGYPAFFAALPPVVENAEKALREGNQVDVVAVDNGSQNTNGANEYSVALTLVLLARYFDNESELISSNTVSKISKVSIRKRLEWILEAIPTVNPPRAILNRVNEFLLTKAH